VTLHITNGESAAAGIRQANLPGDVIAWQDVLHEGPAPAGLSLQQFSDVRARFIAGCGWDAYEDIARSFALRDRALSNFFDHQEIVLWFEHDLYDQLQLIQLLDWFCQRNLGKVGLSLICVGQYLGPMTPARLASLYPERRPISEFQLKLGSVAWRAFCCSDPTALTELLSKDTATLPFLGAALTRHLQQFPALGNGLSRTEMQILEVVASGIHDRTAIFVAAQKKEESIFMGDSAFWRYLDYLLDGPAPLLECNNSRYRITEAGQKVGRAEQDAITLNGFDRWLGGVHVRAPENLWRWDQQNHRLVKG